MWKVLVTKTAVQKNILTNQIIARKKKHPQCVKAFTFSILLSMIVVGICLHLSHSLSDPNGFEETPAGSVIDSLSCGDPLNEPCAPFAVPRRRWSHTRSWLASRPLRCSHTHKILTPFAITTLVSACQPVPRWLSLTTELLLHLVSTGFLLWGDYFGPCGIESRI